MSGPAIARLNDAFRRALPFGRGGRAMLTRSVAALPPDTIARVLAAVRTFEAFTPANDPWQEHDCARFEVDREWFLFKFDYYASDACDRGAASGLDCYRVLTIMRASDY